MWRCFFDCFVLWNDSKYVVFVVLVSITDFVWTRETVVVFQSYFIMDSTNILGSNVNILDKSRVRSSIIQTKYVNNLQNNRWYQRYWFLSFLYLHPGSIVFSVHLPYSHVNFPLCTCHYFFPLYVCYHIVRKPPIMYKRIRIHGISVDQCFGSSTSSIISF